MARAEQELGWATGILGQVEYCRRQNLGETTFSGWERRLGWASKDVGPPVAGRGKKENTAGSSAGIPRRPRGGTLSGKEQEAGLERRPAAGCGQVFFCQCHEDPDIRVPRKTARLS